MKVIARKYCKLIIVLISINVLYAIAGFIVFPLYIKKITLRELAKIPAYTASIGRVSFNPYSFEIAFHHFQIDSAANSLLFSGNKLLLNFDPIASLRSGMPVFKDFLLLDGKLTYVKRTRLSPFLEFLIAFDWSSLPQFRLSRVRVINGGLSYEDISLPKVFSLQIEALNATIDDFLMHGKDKNSISLNVLTKDKEKISLNGLFDLEPYGASGEAFFDNLLLSNYEPRINALAKYTIVDGRLSGQTLYDFDSTPAASKALLRNLSLSINSFSLAPIGSSVENFGFGAFDLDNAELNFVENKFTFDSVLMTGGSLVLDRFFSSAKTRVSPFRGMAKWESVSLGESSFRTKPFRFSFGKMALQNGNVSFSDESFTPSVNMSVTELDIFSESFISGTSPSTEFSATAKIGDQSSIQIVGETEPFNTKGITRFRMLAQNISLLPFNPYLEKYLGYGLNAGSFGLDVNFLLHDRRLTSRNKLILDRVKLGKKTTDYAATGGKLTSFPIPLLVALLKDAKGEIELDLPVTGTLDKPQCEFGKAINEAIFRPISNTFEWLTGQGEKQRYLEFPFDSSAITRKIAGKIDAVIAKLKASPETLIDIGGSVDKRNDTGNLRILAEERAASVKKYLVGKGNIAKERIFVLNSAFGEVTTKGSRVYMYLKTPVTE